MFVRSHRGVAFALMVLTLPLRVAAQDFLHFDFPGLQIGVAQNEDGPTGVTVFHFTRPVEAVIDVRGGCPGTMNSDALRAMAGASHLDAIVVAGGSYYGLAATTGVVNGLGARLKDNPNWTNIPTVAGSIIYDLGNRRFNAVTPDAALGRAALAAEKPGQFPLGAFGAGRFAVRGYYFGRGTWSGQGAALRQS